MPDNSDLRQAAIQRACSIADEIVAGRRNVIEGAKELFWEALDDYDFAAEAKKYIYDSIGLEKAYGLLDTYSDLQDAEYQWQKDKTNEELLAEVRTELLDELSTWRHRQQ